MNAPLFFAFIIGVVCGAIVLAAVLLVASVLTPEKETEPEDDWDTAEVEESDDDPRVLLVANIRRLTEQGFSQREIGRALGMSQKSVWRIMKRYGIKKA